MTVWGERFRSLAAQEFGWNAERIVVTGAHRVDPQPRTPERLADEGPLRVLLIGQPVSYDEDDFGAWWSWVASSAPGSWPLRLRPHPRQDMDQLHRQLHLAPTVDVTAGRTLAEDFAWADVVVAEYSTTVLEAIEDGVPAIVVDAGSRTDPGFLHQLLPNGIVTGEQGLRWWFDRLAAHPADRFEMLAEQRDALRTIVQRTAPEALEATAQVVVAGPALRPEEVSGR